MVCQLTYICVEVAYLQYPQVQCLRKQLNLRNFDPIISEYPRIPLLCRRRVSLIVVIISSLFRVYFWRIRRSGAVIVNSALLVPDKSNEPANGRDG